MRCPLTLVAGLALIGFCELMLFAVELPARNWATIPLPEGVGLPHPEGTLEHIGRSVGMNMTPMCWIGYVLACDGLLTRLARRRGNAKISPIRARPNRFLFVWLASVPVWCYFDWINFYYMDAWRYHGLPEHAASRYAGYFVAFAAICPGMFLTAHWFNHIGLDKLRTKPVRIGLLLQILVMLLGVSFVTYPFSVERPIGNLTLWVSLMFLLDPINHWLGVRSIIGDWRAGRWGRTLSLMAGGAVCGLCWEFWNYWAISKWTYHLPFVGQLANYRYFEMPWIGFQGFLPFAIECWVVLNTIEALLVRARIRLLEPLPDDLSVI